MTASKRGVAIIVHILFQIGCHADPPGQRRLVLMGGNNKCRHPRQRSPRFVLVLVFTTATVICLRITMNNGTEINQIIHHPSASARHTESEITRCLLRELYFDGAIKPICRAAYNACRQSLTLFFSPYNKKLRNLNAKNNRPDYPTSTA